MNRPLVLPTLLFFGCSSPSVVPGLGAHLTLPSGSNYLLVSSAQLWPHQEMEFSGIKYDIATNDKSQVAYISTSDPNFHTPEGLFVGSTLEQVLTAGAKTPWREPGWAYHTPLPSGWSAAFVSGRGMTDSPLLPTSKVAWFFKRK